MTATLRLVRFQPGTPSWNMAVDEALLVSGGAPLLRFYGWRPFGLSLGWFQDEPAPEERADLAAAMLEQLTANAWLGKAPIISAKAA